MNGKETYTTAMMGLNTLRRPDLELMCSDMGITNVGVRRKPLIIHAIRQSRADVDEQRECWERVQREHAEEERVEATEREEKKMVDAREWEEKATEEEEKSRQYAFEKKSDWILSSSRLMLDL